MCSGLTVGWLDIMMDDVMLVAKVQSKNQLWEIEPNSFNLQLATERERERERENDVRTVAQTQSLIHQSYCEEQKSYIPFTFINFLLEITVHQLKNKGHVGQCGMVQLTKKLHNLLMPLVLALEFFFMATSHSVRSLHDSIMVMNLMATNCDRQKCGISTLTQPSHSYKIDDVTGLDWRKRQEGQELGLGCLDKEWKKEWEGA